MSDLPNDTEWAGGSTIPIPPGEWQLSMPVGRWLRGDRNAPVKLKAVHPVQATSHELYVWSSHYRTIIHGN